MGTVGPIVTRLGLHVVAPAEIQENPGSAAGRPRSRGADGPSWVHLDVDVFDETEFPATDYLMPGGISLAVGREMVQTLGGDERLIGVSVGCYNPEKDSRGSYGAELVERLPFSQVRQHDCNRINVSIDRDDVRAVADSLSGAMEVAVYEATGLRGEATAALTAVHHTDGLSVKDLARFLDVRSPSAVELIGRLERLGLMRRLPGADGRAGRSRSLRRDVASRAMSSRRAGR